MSNQRERPGAGGTGAKKPFVSKNDERLIKNYLGAAHRSREVNRRRGKAYDAPWPLLDAAGFPVVHCECAPGDPPTLKFWCPYCGSVHIHGDVDDGAATHRGAHCWSEAGRAAFARGYILQPAKWGRA